MPTTVYQWITATQQPSVVEVDDQRRNIFAFNVNARATSPTNQHARELVKLLEDAALGTLRDVANPLGDLFIGPSAIVPTDDGDDSGPFTVVVETDGLAPTQTHDEQRAEFLSAQVAVHGKPYTTTEALALAMQRALDLPGGVSVTLP